jgi:hypothetical protein
MRQIYRGRYPITALACLGFLAIWSPAIPSVDLSPTQSKSLNDTCGSHPQPNQGTLVRYTQRPDVAPLTIKTRSGSNYFVKIDDAASGRTVQTLYVYGGYSYETQVPRGTFILKFATGAQWCGELELFGPSTVRNKADRIFRFDDDYEYTIELIPQSSGNLPTKRISREEF